MTDAQRLKSHLLELMAACAPNPVPKPLVYWWDQLTYILGNVTRPEIEEALNALEQAGKIESKLDALSVRRFWVTTAGVSALKELSA